MCREPTSCRGSRERGSLQRRRTGTQPHASRPHAPPRGPPPLLPPPRPLDIRQSEKTVVVAAEINAATRYIYLNRATHISKDIFDPTTNGDSIAKWEGDTLVVDTIGFDPNKGVTAIPGGGFRTANTHLVERYRLLNNGSLLSVRFTWTDPGVSRP